MIVGVNSDESITECKGPPLMNDEERLTMVQSCKFVDEVVPNCPYIMSAEYIQYVINEYNIDYVVHGDDPCYVDGKDVYETAKSIGKFRTIPRTTGVSTTDIVGRILLLTKETNAVDTNLATDSANACFTNKNHGRMMEEYTCVSLSVQQQQQQGRTQQQTQSRLQLFAADIQRPSENMHIAYVDGSWDLFHPGHVSILQQAREVSKNCESKRNILEQSYRLLSFVFRSGTSISKKKLFLLIPVTEPPFSDVTILLLVFTVTPL